MKLFKLISQLLERKPKNKVSSEKSSYSNGQTGKATYGQEAMTQEQESSNLSIGFGLAMVCNSIEALTLNKFVKLVVDDDISQLIINGSPSKEELEAAKLQIISQYQEALPNPFSKQHLDTIKRIDLAAYKIAHVTLLIEGIRSGYNVELIEQLRSDGYKHPFTEESYLSDLERVEESLKGDVHKLEKLKASLVDIDKNSPKGKPTVKDYIRSVNQYNIAFKTNVNFYDDKLFVIVYCTMMEALKEHYKPQQHG